MTRRLKIQLLSDLHLEANPDFDLYLLPDVCLSEGRFLDGTTMNDLPKNIEVVATDGHALRRSLEKVLQ